MSRQPATRVGRTEPGSLLGRAPATIGVVAVAVIVLAVCVGLTRAGPGDTGTAGDTGTGRHPGAVPASPPAMAPLPVGSAESAAGHRPVRLRIPAIGVDSTLVDLGVDAAGALVPPATADVTGWFSAGPAPGDAGPALLAGHVDSRSGPGVFLRLRDLTPGDRIEVTRADGTTVAFVVSRSVQTSKNAFPTDLVYGPTPGPELRLVTCGGSFDPAVRSYRDNVVVEAVPEGEAGWTIR